MWTTLRFNYHVHASQSIINFGSQFSLEPNWSWMIQSLVYWVTSYGYPQTHHCQCLSLIFIKFRNTCNLDSSLRFLIQLTGKIYQFYLKHIYSSLFLFPPSWLNLWLLLYYCTSLLSLLPVSTISLLNLSPTYVSVCLYPEYALENITYSLQNPPRFSYHLQKWFSSFSNCRL